VPSPARDRSGAGDRPTAGEQASPAAETGRHRNTRLGAIARPLGYPALALVTTGLSLLLLQLLVGRQLARQQMRDLAGGVAANVLLGQVALERFSPEALARLSGMRLTVNGGPGDSTEPAADGGDAELRDQSRLLRAELCRRLSPCPALRTSAAPNRGVWVEMGSVLESVWLFVPVPAAVRWPPDPWMLSLSLGIGGLSAGLLFQVLEVQRPLRQLEQALGRVGRQAPGSPLPQRGTDAVRRLTRRFNDMVQDLQRSERERNTMLAGIAHDLRSPLTRLRLRLQLAGPGSPAGPRPEADGGGIRALGTEAWEPRPAEAAPLPGLAAAEADLDALERITEQFLVYAGADRQEAPVLLPLDHLLAETAAVVESTPLELDLAPLERRVRPTAMGRAIANLLENACAHGGPPLRLVLQAGGPNGMEREAAAGDEGFVIEVWDHGSGISDDDWPRALTPFHRLDGARRGQGHSGLGLAIAERIARDHGGGLRRLERDGSFGVALWGRSLPPL
jgi:two-component system osmolarity sensor histidine kinase EnvZ